MKKRPTEPAPAEYPSATGSERVAVDAIFRSDAALRHALSENLKPRQADAEAIAGRVDSAFAAFSLIPVVSEELPQSTYVEPGAEVKETLDRVILEGVEALKSSDAAHGITVSNRAALATVVPELSEGSESAVETKLEKIIEFINEKSNGSSLTNAPAFTKCQAEVRAEEIVAAIDTGSEENVEAADNGTPATTREADELVKDSVNLQMGSATSPEEQLAYGSMPRIPNTADKDETQTRILETFQLRPGASDVTSYHDFHTLQIAFQHVWTRIFDGELEKLGRDLYREYVRLKDYGGVSTADLEVSTADDLQRLIDEVRKLSQWVEDETPRDLRGPGEEAGGGGGKGVDELDIAVKTGVGLATGGLSWVLEWAIKEFAKLGSKPIITWEQFPGPWPPRRDTIQVEKIDGVAPPGNVEIALRTAPESKIKIVELELFDEPTKRYVPGQRIDNRGHITYVSMVLPHAWMATSALEFASEETSQFDTPGRYVLTELGRRITDRSRVTFFWKDS
ncbi:MAG: hypothetical protein ACRDKU_03575 [Gaiellaceae bacterium]